MDDSSRLFDKDFEAAIGRIALNYEYAEFTARELVGALITPDVKLAEIITIPLSTKQLPEYLLALYEYRNSDPEKIERFRGLVATFRKLMQDRHTNLHALWITDRHQQTAQRFKPTINTSAKTPRARGLKTGPTEHDLAYLDDLTEQLSTVYSQLHRTLFDYIKDNPEIFGKIFHTEMMPPINP